MAALWSIGELDRRGRRFCLPIGENLKVPEGVTHAA